MKHPGQFLPFSAGQVYRDLRPEMGVPSIKQQEVLRPKARLHIQRQLQWVHLFARLFCRLGFSLQVGQGLLNPGVTLSPV